MKIKNQNQLLKLKLIKTKIYKKNYTFKNLKIEDIEYRLKKGLQIIHKYHIENKKILFINNSSTIETKIKNLLKNTNHVYITHHLWLNGKTTNKEKTSFYKTSQLNSKSDLIVILNKQISNYIIEENYKIKTPMIFIANELNIFDNKSSYKIPGNFLLAKKKIRNNFFLTLLKAVLKKSKKYNDLFILKKFFSKI